jgi:hypothetical protein
MPGTTDDVSIPIFIGPGSLEIAVHYALPGSKRRIQFVLRDGVKAEILMRHPELVNHVEQLWLIRGTVHYISDSTKTKLQRGSVVDITYNAKEERGSIRPFVGLDEHSKQAVMDELMVCEPSEFPTGFVTFAGRIGMSLMLASDRKDAAVIWVEKNQDHARDWMRLLKRRR